MLSRYCRFMFPFVQSRMFFFLKFQGPWVFIKLLKEFLACGSLLAKKSVAASSMYKSGTSTVSKSCTGRVRKNNKRRLIGNLGHVRPPFQVAGGVLVHIVNQITRKGWFLLFSLVITFNELFSWANRVFF